MVPLVVMAPPLIAVEPAASVVILAKALILPTAPFKLVIPLLSNVKLRAVVFAESSVLLKVILPLPESRVLSAFMATAPV